MATGPMSNLVHTLRRAALLQDGGGLSDGQLLQAFLTGREEAAFAALVHRHGPMVLGVCRRVLRNDHDAEDAFQATFLVFLRKAATVAPRELVGNWLYGVAYRTALKAKTLTARRRAKESRVRTMPQPPEADDWLDLLPVLDQELNRLPEKYRVPVVLCDLEGKGRKEVARHLGWPEGTLSGRLARARQLLARRLARYGLAFSAGALATALGRHAAAAVPGPLLASTVQAAGLTAAGVVSARAAALADGVLKSLLLARLKTAGVVLAAVALLGLGAGLLARRLPADRPAEVRQAAANDRPGKTDLAKKLAGDRTRPQRLLTFTGRVVDYAPDADRLTLALPAERKGLKPRTVDVRLSARTEVVYFAVGPEGARPARDYEAQVWVSAGAAETAVRLHFKGHQARKKSPDLSSPVAAVSPEEDRITLLLPAEGGKSRLRKKPRRLDIRLTEATALTFSNVGPEGARPSAKYTARVWLAPGSTDTAAAVQFTGGKQPKKGLDPLAARPPHQVGTVVAVAPGGQKLTVDTLPAKLKGMKPGKARRIAVRIDKQTRTVYAGVRPGGARPRAGYRVEVWLRKGTPNTAAQVRFTRVAKRTARTGTLVDVADDGQTFTLELPPPKKKGRGAQQLDVRISNATSLAFNGVGPGEARLSEGYRAHVLFREDDPDTAESVVLEKVPVK